MLKTVLGKLKSLHLSAVLTLETKYAVENFEFSTFLTEFSTLSRKSLYKFKTVVKRFALRRFFLKSTTKSQSSPKKCITHASRSVLLFVLLEKRNGFENERV